MEDLELAKKGDNAAFARLIEIVKVKMYKTAISILKNDDDACDAIQETLMSAYKNLNTLNNSGYFSTWIIRILINKCYDIIRTNKKVIYLNEKMQVESNTYYEIYCEKSELEMILNQIDDDLRTITVLYYYDDLTVTEIADILDIPEGTVKSRLSRARDKIFKILKKEEGECFG